MNQRGMQHQSVPVVSDRDGDARGSLSWRSIAWVTWRQDQAKLIVLLVVFVAIATFLVVTGLQMRATWSRLGLDDCAPQAIASHSAENTCRDNLRVFLGQPPASLVGYVTWGLHFVPLLIGMFVGAPVIAREFETGTFRFAWTQGIGRRRWLVGKFALLGAACFIGALLIGLLFSWWYSLFDFIASTGDRWSTQAFGLHGLSYAGWTLFCLALGVFVGILTQRTVAAMAITGAVSAVSALLISWLLRPALLQIAPEVTQRPYKSWTIGDLVVGDPWLVADNGRRLTQPEIDDILRQADAVPRQQFDQWLSNAGYTSWASYQPASRFWIFQAIECVSLVALALLLLAMTLRWAQGRAT